LAELLAAREKLVRQLQEELDDTERGFLISIVENRPEWDQMGFPHLPLLPSIGWKLQNLSQLEKTNPKKFAQQAEMLQQKLG
jgi:hypothetical protein